MAMEDLRGKVEESEYCFYRNLPENPSSSPSQLVNTKVDIDESDKGTGGGPIGVSWVDINKGDDMQPE